MRYPLTALAAIGLFVPALAEEPRVDLREYKTVATAKSTTIKQLSGLPKQPAHLGVYTEPDTAAVRVAAIEPASPADLGGMRVGDRIVAVEGRSTPTVDAFRSAVTALVDGDRAILTVDRDGKSVAVKVALAATSRPMTVLPRAVLGVQMTAADNGVKIENVNVGEPADRAGIRAGDVIARINRADVTSQDKLREILGGYLPGDTVTVVLKRAGQQISVECKLAADRSSDRALGIDQLSGNELPTLTNWDMRRPGTWTKPSYRLAVIVIAYPNQPVSEKIDRAEWDRAFFSTGTYTGKNATGQTVYGSMNDYYREISSGKFKVTGKVFEPISVSKQRNDYTQTSNRSAMLTEALDLLLVREGNDALKDFDGLHFIYAGSRLQTQRGGIFWPHRANLIYRNQRWAYFICPEGGDRMSSISVASHEFGHMLGLPDLYSRPETPGIEGLGIWCTMSTGHGRDGKPLHFSAWCKEQMGWLKPCIIDPSVKQKLILSPINGSADECFKVLLRPDGSEYLLLENRVKKGFDRDLPAEGLLIWRVVDGKPVLEESHGITTSDGPSRYLGSVPYPSPSNSAFTPYTTPSSKPAKVGGLPVHITNIRRLPDGRIIFQIGYEYL
jgi:M6 family metalloprotease-like protein